MLEARSRGRRSRVVPALAIAALLAVCSSGTAIASNASRTDGVTKSKLSGKWQGHYSGAVSGGFTLRWKQTGAKLRGWITLSNPNGSYSIGGSVHEKKIKFGAVGVGATYKGSVQGTSMSGTWNSPEGGGTWSAQKVS